MEHVPAEDIERIVGAKRDTFLHIGRAVSAEQTFYILHSEACKMLYHNDTTQCDYSRALAEHGVLSLVWHHRQDRAVFIRIYKDKLVPTSGVPKSYDNPTKPA